MQARQIVRFEWNGQVSDPFKARAKILKLIKAASGSHEVCGDDQRLEERHSLTDSIGAVLNKVCIVFACSFIASTVTGLAGRLALFRKTGHKYIYLQLYCG